MFWEHRIEFGSRGGEMGVNLLAGEWLTLAPFQIGHCRLPINLALVTKLR